MASVWDEHLVRSKYHLSVARRLFDNFENYQTKRFLSSTLSEMSLVATSLVNAYLLYAHQHYKTRVPIDPRARLTIFEQTATKKFGEQQTKEILLIFDIRRTQKESPVELLRQNKVLLLDNGSYRVLTIERMQQLLENLEKTLHQFPKE